MSQLTKRARHLVQLLAEELDRTGDVWMVMMSGNGLVGSPAWDWRMELGDGDDEDHYVSNVDTNRADVIPITRLGEDQ